MRHILIKSIKLYQRTISPDQGMLRHFYMNKYQHCLMYPTCSEYMLVSIEKHGSVVGLWRGVKRIFRCHPYQKKTIDLP